MLMLCSRPKFGGKQQKTLAFARKCQKSDFNLWSALFVYKAQIFRHYFLSSFSPRGRETGCLRPRLSIRKQRQFRVIGKGDAGFSLCRLLNGTRKHLLWPGHLIISSPAQTLSCVFSGGLFWPRSWLSKFIFTVWILSSRSFLPLSQHKAPLYAQHQLYQKIALFHLCH